jgi:hypothetical protein
MTMPVTTTLPLPVLPLPLLEPLLEPLLPPPLRPCAARVLRP